MIENGTIAPGVLSEVMNIHYYIGDSGRGNALNDALEHRNTIDRHERLRMPECERPQPCAQSGGEYHSFHLSLL